MLSACQNDARAGSEPKSQHTLFPRKRVIRKLVEPMNDIPVLSLGDQHFAEKKAFWCSIYPFSYVEALLVFRVQIFASFFLHHEVRIIVTKGRSRQYHNHCFENVLLTCPKIFCVFFTVAFQSIRTLHPIILFSLLEAVSNHMLWYFTNNVRFVHT